jgi:hypothetical protein
VLLAPFAKALFSNPSSTPDQLFDFQAHWDSMLVSSLRRQDLSIIYLSLQDHSNARCYHNSGIRRHWTSETLTTACNVSSAWGLGQSVVT